MKKFMYVMMVMIMLGGGIIGSVLLSSASAYAGGGGGDSGGDLSGAEAAHFVRLDPLILPVIDKDGITQTISLVIVIEVPSDRTREKVRILSPRLKDAYIQDMYGVLNKNAALRGGVLQVSAIKTRLTKITKRVLGEKNVKNVLLEVVQQKPL